MVSLFVMYSVNEILTVGGVLPVKGELQRVEGQLSIKSIMAVTVTDHECRQPIIGPVTWTLTGSYHAVEEVKGERSCINLAIQSGAVPCAIDPQAVQFLLRLQHELTDLVNDEFSVD